MSKYTRNNLGQEYSREDDNGNVTYNVRKIKKDLYGEDNSSRDSNTNISSVGENIPKPILACIGIVGGIIMIIIFLVIWFLG